MVVAPPLAMMAPTASPKAWAPSKPQEMFTGHKPPVEWSDDLRRILALPRRKPPVAGTEESDALVEVMNARFARHNPRCRCREDFNRSCITSLLPVQAWALYEIATMQGLLGQIGVGGGKTIIGLLAALAMPHCRLAVLMCPPNLVEQLVRDFRLVGQHFWMPQVVCHGRVDFHTLDSNLPCIPKDAPTLHIFPYSLLSNAKQATWLETMKPDAIFADEVHNFADPGSTRTKRLITHMMENSLTTRFGGWTGSLTDDAIADYAHLAAFALRFASPVPLDPEVVKEWGRALDAGNWLANPGALKELCQGKEHVRDGYRRRLHESPGVVHTTRAPIDAKLEITERPVDVPPEVATLLATVRTTWVRPDYLADGGEPGDGEELTDQFALGRCLRELACGFFYRWTFPRGEPEELVRAWLKARKAWNKELREKLKDGIRLMDSPLLCTRAAARFYGDETVTLINEYGVAETKAVDLNPDLPVWDARSWPAWRDIRDAVKPVSKAVRFNDFLVQDAAAWALEHRGIVWWDKREFGSWFAEVSGLPVYGGGPNGGGLLGENGQILEDGRRSIGLSIKAHGTGRDGLQFLFADQLVANPPSSAVLWEQMQGRLHRLGQRAPTVFSSLYKHTPELVKFINKALMRADYITGTWGTEQKLREGLDPELLAILYQDPDAADDGEGEL